MTAFRHRNDLSRKMGAIAHPVRMEMIGMLVEAGCDGLPSGEISRRTGIAPGATSNHLASLNDAGLIEGERDGRFVRYRANMAALTALLDTIAAELRLPAGSRPLTRAGIGLGIAPIPPSRWRHLLRNAPRVPYRSGLSFGFTLRAGEYS